LDHLQLRSAAVEQVALVLQHLLRVLIQFYQRLHQQAAVVAEYLMATLALVVVQVVVLVLTQARQQRQVVLEIHLLQHQRKEQTAVTHL
jgi:hypothetical protein